MNTIVKGISICLLSLLLLTAVSCAGQEAPATPAASAPEETAVPTLPPTAPPLAATDTAEPQPTA
ncbi:MAG: TlpA family protein disulfide reductase, partial [Candidatus Promineifilaceae bacterium]